MEDSCGVQKLSAPLQWWQRESKSISGFSSTSPLKQNLGKINKVMKNQTLICAAEVTKISGTLKFSSSSNVCLYGHELSSE
jgi:hypothetical protein